MEGSALRGGKNPMKPAVSWHTILLARSSVLYLWRPWVAERGCSGQEQALSVSHRTGGFCVLPDEKPRGLLKAESACSGVGGAAKWRGAAKRSLGMELHHRGSQRDIKPAAATLLPVLVVFRFTLWATKIFLVVLGKECPHTVFAELQAGGFVCQHETEHHLNRQQQRMEVPHDGGPFP